MAPCCMLGKDKQTMQINTIDVADASKSSPFLWCVTYYPCQFLLWFCYFSALSESREKKKKFLLQTQQLSFYHSKRQPDYNYVGAIYRFFGFAICIGLAVDTSSLSIAILDSPTLMVSASIFISTKN